jgi:hypothetical protein
MPKCPTLAVVYLRSLGMKAKPQQVHAGAAITLKSGYTMKPLQCWHNTAHFCKENTDFTPKFGFQILIRKEHGFIQTDVMLHAMPTKNGRIHEVTPPPDGSCNQWFAIVDDELDFQGAFLTVLCKERLLVTKQEMEEYKVGLRILPAGVNLMVPTVAFLGKRRMPPRAYPNDISYESFRFFANQYKKQEKFMHWSDIQESNPTNINKLDEEEEREDVPDASHQKYITDLD